MTYPGNYNRQVSNSCNKIRTVWNITKLVTRKLTILEIKVNGEVINNRQDITDSLNSVSYLWA
jgi:hypothetical protein